MKKTTMKLSLAAFAVLGSTTLFAGAVAEGPQLVHSGETIHLDGSQSFARGRITEPKWYIENLTHPVRGATPIVSQELSADIAVPEVNETTEFRYTLSVVSLLRSRTVEYSKNSIVVTVEPTSAEDNATVSHEGFTYGTVVSPVTGRIWLDRNLGATKVCSSINDTDEACYGAYYQWGRNTDGHQLHDSVIASIDSISNAFIEGDDLGPAGGFYDWVNEDANGSLREARWSATDGSSICPVGYRVPTPEEYAAERNFNFLHIAYAGSRSVSKPNFERGQTIYLWTTHMENPQRVTAVTFNYRFGRFIVDREPIAGFSVRCIKD